MEKFVDLHVHTTASDGILTPTQLVEKACRIRLSAVGIADHDTMDGIEEGLKAGEKAGIEVVPGVEFTCYEGEDEYHILGYFIDFTDRRLLRIVGKRKEGRIKRAKAIVCKLNQLGFKTSYKDILRLAKGVIGRPHLAQSVIENPRNKKRLMAEFGEIPSIGKFIESYLVFGRPAYVAKTGLTLKGAIELIHKISGIAVLAHPGFYPDFRPNGLLEDLVSWGLDGIEAIAPVKNFCEIQKYIKLYSDWAEKHNLLITGGSDYHGSDETGMKLGFVGAGIKVPYELFEKMKRHHRQKFSKIRRKVCVAGRQV